MKNIIRSWLGITDGIDLSEYIKKKESRGLVSNILKEAFCRDISMDVKLFIHNMEHGFPLHGMMENIISNKVKDNYSQLLKEKIDNEDFIDDIIERIKRKQL